VLGGPVVPLTSFSEAVSFGPHPFLISPDGLRVVFTFRQPPDPGRLEMASVPIDGGEIADLSDPYAPLGIGGADPGYRISPDGQHVVYAAIWSTNSFYTVQALHSVPISGGEPTRLTDLFLGYPGIDFAVSPDSRRVVFQRYSISPQFTLVPPVFLLGVPLAGGTIVRISPPPGPTSYAGPFRFTPDSQRIVFSMSETPAGPYQLWTVSPDGGEASKLVDQSAPIDLYRLTPDGNHVVYEADGGLYVVPTEGGSVRTLRDPPSRSRYFFWFQVSPDGGRVVDCDGGLFSIPFQGGPETRLDGAGLCDSILQDGTPGVYVGRNGSRAVYNRRRDPSKPYDGFDVFSVPLAGGAPSRRHRRAARPA